MYNHCCCIPQCSVTLRGGRANLSTEKAHSDKTRHTLPHHSLSLWANNSLSYLTLINDTAATWKERCGFFKDCPINFPFSEKVTVFPLLRALLLLKLYPSFSLPSSPNHLSSNFPSFLPPVLFIFSQSASNWQLCTMRNAAIEQSVIGYTHTHNRHV